MKRLHLKHINKAKVAHIRKMPKLLHVNRKKGHKLIFNQDSPVNRLESVMDTAQQKLCSDGPEIRRDVHSYFTNLMQEPKLAADPVGAPPWEQRGHQQLDPFQLYQSGGACCQDELNMLQQMDDPDTFAELLRHLSKNKAAGPDGIPNEILQALPAQLQQAMRQLFVIMWLTNHTPDAWKTSEKFCFTKRATPQCCKIGVQLPLPTHSTKLGPVWSHMCSLHMGSDRALLAAPKRATAGIGPQAGNCE